MQRRIRGEVDARDVPMSSTGPRNTFSVGRSPGDHRVCTGNLGRTIRRSATPRESTHVRHHRMGRLRPRPDREQRDVVRGDDRHDGVSRPGRRRRLAATGTSRSGHRGWPSSTCPAACSRWSCRPDGHGRVTYSGEVYNFAELRAELAALGHRVPHRPATPRSCCAATCEWGERCRRPAERHVRASRSGTSASDELVLVRDRLGIKPLYYYPTPDGVLFGSEPKAILANPLVAAGGRRRRAARAVRPHVKTPGRALWQGMREVAPGHGRHGRPRPASAPRRYWRLEATRAHRRPGHHGRRPSASCSTTSCTRQLVADVPRCVLLSGGLDSSRGHRRSPRRAWPAGRAAAPFSVDFAGHEENFAADELATRPDTPYVRDVAAHVGATTPRSSCRPGDLTDPELRRGGARRAATCRSASARWTPRCTCCSRRSAGQSTVALSGEAADEVFGGYRLVPRPERGQRGHLPVAGALPRAR